ncbi:Protein of unknown function [Gryllus bimaculatus]|nr:Protein of unknown function [Gryllus bimaculatus]
MEHPEHLEQDGQQTRPAPNIAPFIQASLHNLAAPYLLEKRVQDILEIAFIPINDTKYNTVNFGNLLVLLYGNFGFKVVGLSI